MFYVYVLSNPEGRLYIGSTGNLEQRVKRHQDDRAGWTRFHGPWKLVHHESFPTRTEAMRRERVLKNGEANQALHQLINQDLRAGC